jgi:hypothetical protein
MLREAPLDKGESTSSFSGSGARETVMQGDEL